MSDYPEMWAEYGERLLKEPMKCKHCGNKISNIEAENTCWENTCLRCEEHLFEAMMERESDKDE